MPAVPVLRVLADAGGAAGGPCSIIVPRKFLYVADLLAQAFKERQDVRIVVDRRHSERRSGPQPVPVERRRGNRRKPREEMLAVVMGPRFVPTES